MIDDSWSEKQRVWVKSTINNLAADVAVVSISNQTSVLGVTEEVLSLIVGSIPFHRSRSFSFGGLKLLFTHHELQYFSPS